MSGGSRPWVAAAEAARLLGVSRATLYAYVSRGHIRSQSAPGSPRQHHYAREDIERLGRRTKERRDPGAAVARALDWGTPVLDSSITLIDGVSLYYRGHEAIALSRTRSVAEVASLIWTGRFDARFGGASPPGRNHAAPSEEGRPFVARAQSALAAAPAHDSRAFDLRPAGVALTGWRILALLTRTAARATATLPIDQALAGSWNVTGRGVALLRGALILCADHELNVSSFTARCVASAGSHPYAVVIAALAALEGTRHGGASARVESMLAAMRRTRDLKTAVAERLKRGEPLDGFGHPLYRDGDPRAVALLDLLDDRYRKSAELAFVRDVAKRAESVLQEKPTIDFALAAMARVLRLPPGAPLALFAIGRTIGWIGHAIEQYATGQLIRPRARYVGAVPAPPAGAAGSPPG